MHPLLGGITLMRMHPERNGRRAGAAVVAAVLTLVAAAVAVVAAPDDVPAQKKGDAAPPQKTAAPKLGLQLNDPKAFQGYTLVAPLNGKKTYLIDMQGRVVRAWESQYTAGQEAYFLENG